MPGPRISLLDYGAGNVRSIRNALNALGCEVVDVTTPEEIESAGALLFPGVGSFGSCMAVLNERGWTEALQRYVRADRPYLGICLGLQTLFEASEESPGVAGLGVLPGTVGRFIAEMIARPSSDRAAGPIPAGGRGPNTRLLVSSTHSPIVSSESATTVHWGWCTFHESKDWRWIMFAEFGASPHP